MPLILNQKIKETVYLGIWKITETPEELIQLLRPDKEDGVVCSSFKNETRKKHWLSSRLLLKMMLRVENLKVMAYEFGKPNIPGFGGHFSVSHSGEYAAVILSNSDPVGIDIEMIRDKIQRVSERFLDPDELKSFSKNNKPEVLHVYWGAKEALYKLNGKPDIDLRKDIYIEPFDYLCIGEGSCWAWMKTREGKRHYKVHYWKMEGYMLVWVAAGSQ
jgi:4'-phosphopantetheinyl transferase